jgi:hypothetical protein
VGAPVTGEQVPPSAGRLHASHCPPQAVSQHTPSTQNPVPHWFAPEQVPPAAIFGVQAPAAQ